MHACIELLGFGKLACSFAVRPGLGAWLGAWGERLRAVRLAACAKRIDWAVAKVAWVFWGGCADDEQDGLCGGCPDVGMLAWCVVVICAFMCWDSPVVHRDSR